MRSVLRPPGGVFLYRPKVKPASAVFILAALAVTIAAPFVGLSRTSPLLLLDPQAHPLEAKIFFELRLPRVTLAFLAGSALALSGMVFQAIFRNVLATPYTLGISSGAALGATLAQWLGFTTGLAWLNGTALFSLSGAGLTILLVFVLASPARGFSPTSMLLAGVTVSFFFSSLILAIQYISDFTQVFQVTRWLMGSLDIVGFRTLFGVLPLVLLGMILVLAFTRELDLITLGDELAMSRGLNAVRTRIVLFSGTSLMVGGVVAICGPIGFVGLIIPYLCRLIAGTNHRRLFWLTLLTGGAFLTFCDTISRIVIAPSEVPVGVVTALLGGPFFLWILRNHRENPRL